MTAAPSGPSRRRRPDGQSGAAPASGSADPASGAGAAVPAAAAQPAAPSEDTPTRPPTSAASGFDRLRPRSADPRSAQAVGELPRDVDGARLLFTQAEAPPATGHAAVRCSRCGQRTVISLPTLVRLAVPAVHLPLPGREHRSYLRCPACRRRSWVAVEIAL